MNKLFLALLLNFAFFNGQIFAKVIEASNLKVIMQEIKQLDNKALVVFDVDYTLIVPNDLILGPCGEVYFQEFMKRLRAMKEKGEILGSKISLEGQVSLVDKEVIPLLSWLKQKNIKTIALTAMPTGKFGLIQNTEEWRIKQLDALSINFAWSFPSLDSVTLQGFEGKNSLPVFKDGILASAKYPKGEVLLAFLKHIGWKPSKVIFIDDQLEYIESVEKELAKARISSISFHYTSALNQPNQLNKEVADLQLNHLIEQEKWLSDKEAKRIILERKA